MSSLWALLGLLLLAGSIFTSAFMGQQIATIGVGLILLGILVEVRRANKIAKTQAAKTPGPPS